MTDSPEPIAYVREPVLGDLVYAHTTAAFNNGSLVCGARITRVFGQRPDGAWTVNLRLTADGPPEHDEWKTSVALFGNQHDAIEHGPSTAWWPFGTEYPAGDQGGDVSRETSPAVADEQADVSRETSPAAPGESAW